MPYYRNYFDASYDASDFDGVEMISPLTQSTHYATLHIKFIMGVQA